MISSFSVIADTHTDRTKNNTLLCSFAGAHDLIINNDADDNNNDNEDMLCQCLSRNT